jgi:hypothetical protein
MTIPGHDRSKSCCVGHAMSKPKNAQKCNAKDDMHNNKKQFHMTHTPTHIEARKHHLL